MSQIGINEILKYLPHRFPFLLVDRVIESDGQTKLTAIKNVTINEPFFTGHFPQRPVMPGVLILEALAQASGILIFQVLKELPGPDNWFYLAGMDKARFKRIVEPGDQLKLDVELLKTKGGIWKFKGVASVDGELACSAEVMNAKGAL